MRRHALTLTLALAASAGCGLACAQTPAPASSATVQARIEHNMADAASPPHGPAAAASMAGAATAAHNARAEAAADLAARQSGSRSKLKVDKENLLGRAAAPALQQGVSPANYDHSISMGDKDHVQQVTNVRVYVKKPGE